MLWSSKELLLSHFSNCIFRIHLSPFVNSVYLEHSNSFQTCMGFSIFTFMTGFSKMPHSSSMLNVFDRTGPVRYKISGNSHAYFLKILQILYFCLLENIYIIHVQTTVGTMDLLRIITDDWFWKRNSFCARQ